MSQGGWPAERPNASARGSAVAGALSLDVIDDDEVVKAGFPCPVDRATNVATALGLLKAMRDGKAPRQN